jgi:hypothetical protein
MPSSRTINYEVLAQDAMRGLVRAVLSEVAKSGLPGDHHFYISFDTQAPGASISKRLKAKYPEEMTIVLQHRFWDLAVTDERFEVKLSFDGIPERLVVPFASIRVFFDPSVRYGLQFEEPGAATGPIGDSDALRPVEPTSTSMVLAMPQPGGARSGPRPLPRPVAERKPRAPRKPRGDKTGGIETTEPEGGAKSDGVEPAATKLPAAVPPAKPADVIPPSEKAAGKDEAGGAQVVSLSDFRKK